MDVGDGHCLGGGGTARASVRRVDALICRVREDVDKVEPRGNAQRHERRRRGAANERREVLLEHRVADGVDGEQHTAARHGEQHTAARLAVPHAESHAVGSFTGMSGGGKGVGMSRGVAASSASSLRRNSKVPTRLFSSAIVVVCAWSSATTCARSCMPADGFRADRRRREIK
jgi:hypothetical protein